MNCFKSRTTSIWNMLYVWSMWYFTVKVWINFLLQLPCNLVSELESKAKSRRQILLLMSLIRMIWDTKNTVQKVWPWSEEASSLINGSVLRLFFMSTTTKQRINPKFLKSLSSYICVFIWFTYNNFIKDNIQIKLIQTTRDKKHFFKKVKGEKYKKERKKGKERKKRKRSNFPLLLGKYIQF